MINRKLFLILGIIVFLSALALPSLADQRSYVWTYEYKTMPRGKAEIEYYNTLEYPDSSAPKVSTWKQNLELEYGVTDNLDVSIYQNFKQSNSASASSFAYDGWKMRTRYRVGQVGRLPVDPLLYFELQGPNDLAQQLLFEGKIVMAKDLDRLNLSYNQILKKELKDGSAAQNEYAAGASFEFNPAFKLGVEGKGSYTSGKHYFGPTLSFTAESLWFNLGFLRGLGNGADQLQARLLMGLHI